MVAVISVVDLKIMHIDPIFLVEILRTKELEISTVLCFMWLGQEPLFLSKLPFEDNTKLLLLLCQSFMWFIIGL